MSITKSILSRNKVFHISFFSAVLFLAIAVFFFVPASSAFAFILEDFEQWSVDQRLRAIEDEDGQFEYLDVHGTSTAKVIMHGTSKVGMNSWLLDVDQRYQSWTMQIINEVRPKILTLRAKVDPYTGCNDGTMIHANFRVGVQNYELGRIKYWTISNNDLFIRHFGGGGLIYYDTLSTDTYYDWVFEYTMDVQGDHYYRVKIDGYALTDWELTTSNDQIKALSAGVKNSDGSVWINNIINYTGGENPCKHYVDTVLFGEEYWKPGGLPEYYEIPPQDSSNVCGVNIELDSIEMLYVHGGVTYDTAYRYQIWQKLGTKTTVKVTTQRLYAYKTDGETCFVNYTPADLEFGLLSAVLWFRKNEIYKTYPVTDLEDLFCDGYGDYWVRLEIVNDDGKCYSAPFRVLYSSDNPADASWTDIIAELPPEELGHLEKLLLPYVGWLESEIRERYNVLMVRFPLNWVSGLYNDLSDLVDYEPGVTTYLSFVLEVDYLDEEVLDVDMLPISDLVDGSSGLGEDFTDFISTIRSIIIFMTWITLGLYIFRRVSSFISGLSGVESGGITSTGSGGSTNWG